MAVGALSVYGIIERKCHALLDEAVISGKG